MEEHKNAYKVLIADDDPVVHQSLNAYFKRENFTTASAFDGEIIRTSSLRLRIEPGAVQFCIPC